jgi:hypothetical protein
LPIVWTRDGCGSKIFRAVSQLAPLFVLRANHVGPRKASACAYAWAGVSGLLFGDSMRSHTA